MNGDDNKVAAAESGLGNYNEAEGDGMVALALLVVQNFRFLIVVTIAGTLFSVALSFLLPNIYKAETRVIPSSRLQGESSMGLSSSLRGASSLMGVNLSAGGDISDLFGQILRNKDLVEEILRTEFIKQDSTICTLAEFLDPEFKGTPQQVAKLVAMFKRSILKVRLDPKSGVTTVAVELQDPSLSHQVAGLCIEKLDVLYQKMMQTQASLLVEFLDARQLDSERNLMEAETSLQHFIEENRRVQGSPTLLFEQARLERVLKLKTEAFLSLSAQLEMARIEVFRSLPSILVLDPAQRPYNKSKPNRVIILVVSAILFCFLGFCFILVRAGRHRFRRFAQIQGI